MTRPGPEDALLAVADYFGVAPSDLRGNAKRAHLRRPSRVLCLVLAAELEYSHASIGQLLGVGATSVRKRLMHSDAEDIADAHRVVGILDRRTGRAA